MTEDKNKTSLKKIVGDLKKNVYEKEFDPTDIKNGLTNIILAIAYTAGFIVIIYILARIFK